MCDLGKMAPKFGALRCYIRQPLEPLEPLEPLGIFGKIQKVSECLQNSCSEVFGFCQKFG